MRPTSAATKKRARRGSLSSPRRLVRALTKTQRRADHGSLSSLTLFGGRRGGSTAQRKESRVGSLSSRPLSSVGCAIGRDRNAQQVRRCDDRRACTERARYRVIIGCSRPMWITLCDPPSPPRLKIRGIGDECSATDAMHLWAKVYARGRSALPRPGREIAEKRYAHAVVDNSPPATPDDAGRRPVTRPGPPARRPARARA